MSNIVQRNRHKPLQGHFTREQFKEVIWNWLDKYADEVEQQILLEELKAERIKRLSGRGEATDESQ